MSRPLGSFLVLLALWVQILAPVATLRAVMGTAVDPLAGLTLCGHSLADEADLPDHDRHPAPTLCGLCCAAIAVLDSAAPPMASVALAWTILVLMAPPDGEIRSVERTLTRVRDPPILA